MRHAQQHNGAGEVLCSFAAAAAIIGSGSQEWTKLGAHSSRYTSCVSCMVHKSCIGCFHAVRSHRTCRTAYTFINCGTVFVTLHYASGMGMRPACAAGAHFACMRGVYRTYGAHIAVTHGIGSLALQPHADSRCGDVWHAPCNPCLVACMHNGHLHSMLCVPSHAHVNIRMGIAIRDGGAAFIDAALTASG